MRVWMGGFKCELSVNPIQTLQNVVGALEKTEAAFYCFLDLGRRGGGGGGGRGENGISNLIFSPPPFFTLTITPLKLPKK